MTHQTLNSSLLRDAAEVLKQTANAAREKAQKVYLNANRYYKWVHLREECVNLIAELTVRAEELEEQERKDNADN